ncbi:hypothetical protein [Sorangium sp. So ce1024]
MKAQRIPLVIGALALVRQVGRAAPDAAGAPSGFAAALPPAAE